MDARPQSSPPAVPLSLLREWQASVMTAVIAIGLASVCLNQSRPWSLAALAVAAFLLWELRRQLPQNHRPGESAIEFSYGGKMGKAMEVALEPIGQDWRVGVGLVGSFMAREVLVSTMGLVYGIDVRADESSESIVVDVTMTYTTPMCPLGPQIIADVEQVLMAKGADLVNVNVVFEPMWIPDMMTDDLKRELGILEDEEPELEIDPPTPAPPIPPKKKGFFGRLFGG